MLLPEGTLSGRLECASDLSQVNSVLMLELGSEPSLRPNLETIELVYGNNYLKDLPKFASGSIARAIRVQGYYTHDVHAFEGPSAKGLQENTGTYGELVQFKRIRDANPGKYNRTAVVTSAFNEGNVLRQAALPALALGGLVVPEGLTRSFDWKSDQWWTKAWPLWVIGAVPRIVALRRTGH